MARRYTIAVDFDSTIHSYTTPWKAAHVIPDPPVDGALQWLRDMLVTFDVVVFSTRCKTWRGRRAMRRWLWEHDTGGAISQAQWEDTEILGQVKFSKSKPIALILLDDRAVRFDGPGTFPSRDSIHRYIPWNKKKPKASE